ATVYVCSTVGHAWMTLCEPSPKSNWYEAMPSPSGSDDGEPSKVTVSGTHPSSGVGDRVAIGAACGRREGLPARAYGPVGADACAAVWVTGRPSGRANVLTVRPTSVCPADTPSILAFAIRIRMTPVAGS